MCEEDDPREGGKFLRRGWFESVVNLCEYHRSLFGSLTLCFVESFLLASRLPCLKRNGNKVEPLPTIPFHFPHKNSRKENFTVRFWCGGALV